MSKQQAPGDPEFLLIGRVAGTFGWAGEIKVRPETDFPQRFADLKAVHLEQPDGSRQLCQVTAARVNPRQIRLKLAGYDSKEASAALLGALLLVPAEQAFPLPEGHYYLHQLLGLQVRDSEGRELGPVIEIARGPVHDVYVTPLAAIPARKEAIKKIDLEQRELLVEAGNYADNSES